MAVYKYNLKDFLNDRKKIINNINSNYDNSNIKNIKKYNKLIEKLKDRHNIKGKSINIVGDFTEYNPFHNGHKYCLEKGKEKGIFVSVIPGPLERSGRGIPYFINRHIRAEMALKNGADIVVEGPPIGVMGSGQYMQCLIKLFSALKINIIPRGYIPENTMNNVINCINSGNHISLKPYKIKCIETNKIIGEKLQIDNYVIASMSNTIYKLNNKYNLNYNPKFLFVGRLGNISGSKIRENILKGKYDNIVNLLPESTINILEKYNNIEEIILNRFENRILETINEFNLKDYIPENVANILYNNKHYNNSIEKIKKSIPNGFSKHFKERILTKLECRINKEHISSYIENYPYEINILGYNI